jgi:glycerol kinase
MPKPLILALDTGTTSTRALVFELGGGLVAQASQPLAILTPNPGWVEQDGVQIVQSSLNVIHQVLEQLGERATQIAGLGLTNQRETILVWERGSGKPIHPAIVWQDRRTADSCAALRAAGHESWVQASTGLLLDPYFSATKLAWILDHVPGARAQAEQGLLAAGTVETYLTWCLSGGISHITDATNASRTALYDLASGAWSARLLDLFRVPRAVLPEITDSAGRLATTKKEACGFVLPIASLVGDQQSAAIGQACIQPGMAKITLGTGAFLLAHVGAAIPSTQHRLLGTVAWQLNNKRAYALEGSLFVAGSALQWLRDGLGVLEDVAQSGALAASVPDSAGVFMVPAFAGLGAPYWDAQARGLICGLTRGTTRAHLVRATLEAMGYQAADLLEAFAGDGAPIAQLRVDGGMAANDWLMQWMADLLDIPVARPHFLETTAYGAALLACVGLGLAEDIGAAAQAWQAERIFTPDMAPTARLAQLALWRQAVARARYSE